MQASVERVSTPAIAPRRAAAKIAPLFPAALVVAIFVPEPLSFYVFDFRLTVARAILLILLPFTILVYGKLVVSAQYKFALSDLAVPLALSWMIVAPANTDGLEAGLKSGGVIALEFCGAYAVARCLLNDGDDARAIARLFCILAGVAGFLGLLDQFVGNSVFRDELAHLTGYQFYHPDKGPPIYRLGLLRSQGPLEHPILYGIAMCFGLLLARHLEWTGRWFARFGCGLGVFLSLATAPWTAAIMGAALMLYGRKVNFPHKWLTLVLAGSTCLILFYAVHPNPFGWIFSHLLLTPVSGYYRMLVWNVAGDIVLQSPFFGVGMTDDWPRPDWMPFTVDALWLRLAMMFGIPGSILVAFSIMGACWLPARRTNRNAGAISEQDVKLAETLGIIAFLTIFLGFTVHFWGSTWILIGLLTGVRAHLGQLAAYQWSTKSKVC